MKQYIKKYRVAILIVFACVGGAIMFAQVKENVTLKQDVVKVEVNCELNEDVETYFDGVKHPEQVLFHFDGVEMDTLGEYKGSIAYKGEVYEIVFQVIDTTKPKIDLSMNAFSFHLDTTLQEVNDMINREIIISNNYDSIFSPIQVIDEIPSEARKVESRFTVKDTQGNESEEATIFVDFIDDEAQSSKEEPTPPQKTPLDPTPPTQESSPPPVVDDSPSMPEPPTPPPLEDTTPPPLEDTTPPQPSNDIVYEEKLSSWDEALKRADELTGWLDSPYPGYKYMIVPAQSGSVTLLILKE